jgi:ribosomal protein L11 methyltransferase
MAYKKYIKLQFPGNVSGQNDQLIALLADAGFTGFEEEETALTACIEEKDFNQETLDSVLQLIQSTYSMSIIEDQNWNAEWESSFDPIMVNGFVAIRAAFHQPVKNVTHEIIITPKMSFGTGHHATTHMMIEQMQALDFAGKTVVDYGTGTGVLAILAEKMGATRIDAIDYDDWSIENAMENAAANACTGINLIKNNTLTAGKVYDIVLANINLQVILQNMQAIKPASAQGSYILLSGFMTADEAVICKALMDTGIQPVRTLQKSGWLCILAENKQPVR